jgi:hypothetical protein
MMLKEGNGVMGLIFRQQDSSNFYTFEYSDFKLRFKKMKNGMLSGIILLKD